MTPTHTTYVQTRDGAVYDLGRRQYPPSHAHADRGTCPHCCVVNAWTGPIKQPPTAAKAAPEDP